jgi:hypothetical protein
MQTDPIIIQHDIRTSQSHNNAIEIKASTKKATDELSKLIQAKFCGEHEKPTKTIVDPVKFNSRQLMSGLSDYELYKKAEIPKARLLRIKRGGKFDLKLIKKLAKLMGARTTQVSKIVRT